ncbi:unnamed protein product [Schistocephalus solidus]|uniref:Uncharacterized protein n=1 Tax=Schistocephalus solidus TaxID=70667 RepID=A0A183SIS5_SCHSO|nr:unnamed protein product [Schistocephalus solidus]
MLRLMTSAAYRGSPTAKHVVNKIKQQQPAHPTSIVPSGVPPGRLNNPRSSQPERRAVLVARELARYKMDIAALSETRFCDQDQLEEVGAG